MSISARALRLEAAVRRRRRIRSERTRGRRRRRRRRRRARNRPRSAIASASATLPVVLLLVRMAASSRRVHRLLFLLQRREHVGFPERLIRPPRAPGGVARALGVGVSAASASRMRAATAAVARARAAIFVAGSAGLASITPAGTQPTVMMWPSPGFGRSLVDAKCGVAEPGRLLGGVTS